MIDSTRCIKKVGYNCFGVMCIDLLGHEQLIQSTLLSDAFADAIAEHEVKVQVKVNSKQGAPRVTTDESFVKVARTKLRLSKVSIADVLRIRIALQQVHEIIMQHVIKGKESRIIYSK